MGNAGKKIKMVNRPVDVKPESSGNAPPPKDEPDHAMQQQSSTETVSDPPALSMVTAQPAIPVIPTNEMAYVTMASGNEAGRMATVLVRSLLDAGTSTDKFDIVVLLPRGGVHSPECHSPEFRRKYGLKGEKCGAGGESIPEEVISPHLVEALRRMGAKMVLIDAIPSTRMTEGIPGGRSSFWGMALNKLVVFNMTQYRKVVWMDSDTYALKVGASHEAFPQGRLDEQRCVRADGVSTRVCYRQQDPFSTLVRQTPKRFVPSLLQQCLATF